MLRMNQVVKSSRFPVGLLNFSWVLLLSLWDAKGPWLTRLSTVSGKSITDRPDRYRAVVLETNSASGDQR